MLNESQLREFERDGCLVVPGVVDPDTLAQVKRDYHRRARDLLQRHIRAGRLPPTPPTPALSDSARPDSGSDSDRSPADDGFAETVSRLICGDPDSYQHLDISLPMDENLADRIPQWQNIFGDQWRDEAGIFAAESVHRLLTHPNIAAIAAQIVGENPVCSPVQHARIKPPQRLLPPGADNDANFARTLWHQDEAVVHEGARGANILTVWIAVTNATIENGCMHCVPGSHLAPDDSRRPDFGLKTHCPGKKLVAEIYIPDELVPQEKRRPLEAGAGDIVLLHRRAAHGAGPNESDGLRWSFDLRYQPAGSPTGRECFPSFPANQRGPDAAREYKRQWLNARDRIIRGEVPAAFNTRWLKYQDAQLCA